jgi:hypothetical protein
MACYGTHMRAKFFDLLIQEGDGLFFVVVADIRVSSAMISNGTDVELVGQCLGL